MRFSEKTKMNPFISRQCPLCDEPKTKISIDPVRISNSDPRFIELRFIFLIVFIMNMIKFLNLIISLFSNLK